MNKRAVIWVAVSSQRQAKDDKISLPYQEEKAREWCTANGYDVIEVLSVEGHSRSDPNLVRLLELYEKKGVTAYARLQELWAAQNSFDVLVAYSMDRLGRSGALIHWVIETCYYEGRQVCLTDGGGLLDPQNYRMQALLGTAQATMPMDALKDKARVAKEKMESEGLITGAWPASHKPIYDPDTGKIISVVVNEDNRILYETAVQLLIDGLSWANIGVELFRRGFVNEEGKPYGSSSMRTMLLNGWLFGHNIRGHRVLLRDRPRGRWLFDEGEVPPDGVRMYRNTIPPLFHEGHPLLEPFKAELRRRFQIRGRASTKSAHRFSRLILCDECVWLMSVQTRGKKSGGARWGYFCGRAKNDTPIHRRCTQRKTINNKIIQPFVQKQLERFIRTGQFVVNPQPEAQTQTERLAERMKRLSDQIDRLIEEQSFAPEGLRERYRARIESAGNEMAQCEADMRQMASRTAAAVRIQQNQAQAIDFIKSIDLEAFWQMPDPEINRWLLRFFGDMRIAVREGEIVSLKQYSPR
jgi:DNA invertase Pin-like site-specific DNA recombinase